MIKSRSIERFGRLHERPLHVLVHLLDLLLYLVLVRILIILSLAPHLLVIATIVLKYVSKGLSALGNLDLLKFLDKHQCCLEIVFVLKHLFRVFKATDQRQVSCHLHVAHCLLVRESVIRVGL